MGVELTYTAVGNREDLSDVITNISPTDTPIYSTIGRTVAKATYHEWVEEELAEPGANSLVEGGDYNVTAPTPRVRKGNYTQIFTRAYGVSETQQAVLKAGIKDEIAHLMRNALKEIARDVEYAIINNAAAVAGDATTPRQMGGIPAFVQTNVLSNGGTTRPLTEDLLLDAIEAAWKEGGNPDTVVVSGSNKRTISGFTASSTKTISADDKRLVASVDVYESDFGLVKIVADRVMPSDKVFILSKDYLKVAYLRPFRTKDLPQTGDRIAKAVVGELTLEVRAEKAQAIITDIG